ncbi:protein NUCLEOLAR FACTOR 1 isoform X2 [Typha angustifolia]|uniref:protein NUCLEOLAR FACTOR 1 isoform X2 n=1 Tax=Typha angustifolia TaxID=59011 RepID=UPI003C2CCD1A
MGKSLGLRKGWKRPKEAQQSEVRKESRRKILDDRLEDAETPNTVASDDGVLRESSTFDSLLKALRPGSKKLAAVYRMREKEEKGRSDTEEDENDEFESSSLSEGEDVDGGSEYSLADAEGDDLRENQLAHMPLQVEEDDTGDEDESMDGDDVQGMQNNSQNNVNETESSSSFHRHIGHVLTKEEVDKLTKQKAKFDWKIPAVGMLNAEWVGTGECILEETSRDLVCDLKEKLYNHWLNIYRDSRSGDFHSSRQSFFFSLCNSYRDIMHCNKRPFYLKGSEEDSCIMDAYIMHALNHVYRTRDHVIKNDAKLEKHEHKEKEILNCDAYLDQGFTRPKVLFLLPLASIASRVVKRLIQLTPLSNKDNVGHIDRFTEEFGNGDSEPEDDRKDGSSESQTRAKPADFQVLFGGNNNDHFMLGIKFTKRSIKLYSDFYSSDIIVASPLGLVTKIGKSEFEKEKDIDYLSSIEMLIIDHADVIAMQNWSHVNTVLEQLNRIPSKQHGTDVMRIRPWYLDGNACFYRQTILLSSYLNPDMNALFHRQSVNYEGKVKLVIEYKGVLPKILLQVGQVYERFDASSIISADDARLDYFCKKVFPKIKDSVEGGILLFISSYFEFVRIRNFLKSQNASFCLLGEYTKQSDISRARIWFFEGKRKIMLYTERSHFYHRYKIRGIKNLIFYSLPERKEFYPEIINMLDGSDNRMCNVLFSCFDHFRLERIVGTSSAKRMLSSNKDMFVFC